MLAAIRSTRSASALVSVSFRSSASSSRLSGPKNRLARKTAQPGEQVVLADPHTAVAWEALVCGLSDVPLRLTGVVRGAMTALAEHPLLTDLAEDERPQRVGPLGLRVLGVGPTPRTGPFRPTRDAGGSLEQLARDQRLVGRVLRPDTQLGRIDLPAGLGGPAVDRPGYAEITDRLKTDPAALPVVSS